MFLSVGAVLEHEAIAGLSAGKPTGLRGRALSNSREDSRRKDASLDALMKAVSTHWTTTGQLVTSIQS